MAAATKNRGIAIHEVVLIIAVLAIVLAVAIPPGPWSLKRKRGPSVQALTEISNIELGITKLLSDTNTSSLRAFFDDTAFGDMVVRLSREQGLDAFEASVEIYSYSAYVLLRKGRNALGEGNEYRDVLRPDLVQKLGNSYMPELALDPWGNLYRIYPGPWPESMGPVLFRTYLQIDTAGPPGAPPPVLPDNLLMTGKDLETGEVITFGWPADAHETTYIWSLGANSVSGQPHYDPTHAYAPPAQQYYDSGQEPEFMGGGDDINNWDHHQTFMRFYN